MKKLYIIIAGAVLAVAGLIWTVKSCGNDDSAGISSRIHLLKEETIPIRFKLYTKQGSGLMLAGKLFDLDGNAVGRFETPFINNNGPISIHVTDVDINGRHISFPNLITYGEGASEIDLTQYYYSNGFPQVYNSSIIDSVLKVEIGRIFDLIISGKNNKVENQYGSITYLSSDIEHPREGVNYEFHVSSNGKIYYLKAN